MAAASAADPGPVGAGDVFLEDFGGGLVGWKALTGAIDDWSVSAGADPVLSVDTRGQSSGRYIRPTASLSLPDRYELRTHLRIDEIEREGTVTFMLDMLAPDNIKASNIAPQFSVFDPDGNARIQVADAVGGSYLCSGTSPVRVGEWVELMIRRAGGVTSVWTDGQLVAAVASPAAGGTFGIGSYKTKYSLGAISIDALAEVPDDQPDSAIGCLWTVPPTPPDEGTGSGTVAGDGVWVPAAATSGDRPGHEAVAGEGTISLDGGWRFSTDASRTGETADYPDPETDTSAWDELAVPGNWDQHDRYGEYRGVGWYKTNFQTGDVDADVDQRAWLRFGAVYWSSTVWLNGQRLGDHVGGYTPFEFDVTNYLVDGENTLVVKADNTFKQGAWWSWGGISRSVELARTNKLRIVRQEVVSTPDPTDGTALVTSTVFLQNTGDTDEQVTVSGAISTASGTPLAAGGAPATSATLLAGETTSVTLSTVLPAGSFNLWDLDTPNRYRFNTTLAAIGDTVLHAVSDVFGVRSFTIDGTSFLLNGQKIKLAGANRVSDNPIDGNTEPISTVRRDLDRMKASGLNFARIIHYPQSPELLDYADEIGMLLIAENPVWGGDRNLTNDIPQIQHEFREMVERDINHPSIIAYSVANEISSNSAAGISYDRIMAEFSRAIDPSRYVTQVSNNIGSISSGDQDGSQYMDFVSINMYGGFAGGADHAHAMYPDVPIFVSEYSPDGFTFGIDRETLDFTTGSGNAAAAFASRDFVAGWSQWTYNDYRSDYSGSGPNVVRGWGDIDVWGREKVAYDAIQSANAPVKALDLSNISSDGGKSLGLVTIVPRGPLASDGPAWTLSGYRLTLQVADSEGGIVGGTMIGLDDIAPGDDPVQVPVAWKDGGAGTTVRVTLLSPTGYEVAVTNAGIELPSAPAITDTIVSATSIRVRYSDPAASRSYHVEARTADGTLTAQLDTAELFADLGGLTTGTAYIVTVAAVNSVGTGLATEITATPTGSLAMAPKVVNLAAIVDGLVLGFSDNTVGAEFEVRVAKAGTGEVVQNYTTRNRPGTRIEGLATGQSYDVSIRRLSGADPATVWSEPLRGTASGSSSAPALTVRGTIASTRGGGVVITPSEGTERYLVTVSGPGVDRSYPVERAAVDLLPVDGLQPGSSYTVTVASESATGRSAAWSGVIATHAVPSGGTVAAPVDLGFENRGTDVFLTWRPGGAAGDPVDGYVVTRTACGTTTQAIVLGQEFGIGTIGRSGGGYTVASILTGVVSEPTAPVTVPGEEECVFVITPDDTAQRTDGSVPFSASTGWVPSSLTGPGGYSSVYAESSAFPGATATWLAPNIGPARFRIEVSIPDSYGSPSARYTLHTADGDEQVTLNQSTEKGTWFDLGEYDFTAEQRGNVTVTGGSSGYLRASAVRFTRILTTKTPAPPSPTFENQTVRPGAPVMGTGSTVGDTVVLSDKDGAVLGTSTVAADLSWSVIPDSVLSLGPHIGLVITEKDAEGWSGTATATVVVVPGDPDEPALSLSSSTVVAGGTVIITGSGFGSQKDLGAVLHSDPVSLGTFAADVNGGFSRTLTIPARTTPGAHTIVITGAASGSVSLALTVTAPAADPGGLASTGATATEFVPLTLLILVLGAALVMFGRMRRRKSLEQ